MISRHVFDSIGKTINAVPNYLAVIKTQTREYTVKTIKTEDGPAGWYVIGEANGYTQYINPAHIESVYAVTPT